MKLYKSISPKNTEHPIIFEETSQKIYSFEGFIFYSLKHWLEATDMISTEIFMQWLVDILGLKEASEFLYEIRGKDLTACKKLLLFIESAHCMQGTSLLQLKQELLTWDEQPLQVQMKKRGDKAFHDKQYSKAIKFYKLAQVEGFDPLVEHNIGAAYIHLNLFIESERALHNALKHSDQLEIHLNLIRLLKVTNRTNEAIARAKDLMIRYNRWEVHFECGTIYFMKQLYDQAFNAFTKAYELEHQVIILKKLIETSLAFQTSEETRCLLEALKESSQEEYCIYRSRVLVRENKVDEALECLEDGLMTYKESKAITLEISKVCRVKKQIIKAINAVLKAQVNGVDEDEVLYEMALIAKRAGNRKDYEGKIEELKKLWKSSIRSKYIQ